MANGTDVFSSNALQSDKTSCRYYWASYGLLVFCARFRYDGDADLGRGQRVLLRSHRGLELGHILWLENSLSAHANEATVASPSWSATGVILRPVDEGDPWLRAHHRLLDAIQKYLERRLRERGCSGIICDLEYIQAPDQLGILYLGLEPDFLLELELALQSQFHLRAEWYDARDLLGADQVWEERQSSPLGATVAASRQAGEYRCGNCSCSGGCHRQASEAENRSSYSAQPTVQPATAIRTPAQPASPCLSRTVLAGADSATPLAPRCSGCVFRDWQSRQRRTA